MEHYEELRKICEKNSRISEWVIDDFLIGYAARHHNLEKKMNQEFGRYRHVTGKFEKGTVNMLKSQFIAHRVFCEGGLIGTFMKHPALERFRGEERDFLDRQLATPWRFSFSEIMEEPARDFFRMKDIFPGTEFLLFSPGISQIKASVRPVLWFNLIGYNGACWQSFGPIGAYRSFQPEDIWFFATEINPEIGDREEVPAGIERDPLPYMMLHSGAAYPLTFHQEDQVIYAMAEHDLETLDTAGLKKSFTSEFEDGVYRFTHSKWGEHPHFAQAYYDENLKLILFTAMTDRGFGRLVKDFNAFGHDFPAEPYLRINLQMLVTTEGILKRKIVLNEYEEMFRVESDPKQEKAVEDLNAFISLVLPDINAGRAPDIEAAAMKTGVHLDSAKDVVNMIMGKLEGMPGGGRKQGGAEQEETEREEAAQFREIYLLAEEIRQREPWKGIYESDLFGIRIPGTDRIYFVSVMGANGEYTALTAYKGYEGLTLFLEFLEYAETMPAGTIMTLPHLMLSYTDREYMDKENLDAIKKAGLKFRGKGRWPKLEEQVPGYLPAFPEGDALSDLPVLLEQVAMVITRAKVDRGYLFPDKEPEDTMLIRSSGVKSGPLNWKDSYEKIDPEKGVIRYKMSYRRESCAGVSRLSVSPVTLQADLVMMLSPVKERGRKGYFPFVLLLVDKGNGIVTGMEMLVPEPDLQSMHESIAQKLLEEIGKLGFRPEKIEIRSELLFGLVEGALKEAWCRVEKVERLPELEEAAGSLIEHLGSGP